jgi:hypothetical protein
VKKRQPAPNPRKVVVKTSAVAELAAVAVLALVVSLCALAVALLK